MAERQLTDRRQEKKVLLRTLKTTWFTELRQGNAFMHPTHTQTHTNTHSRRQCQSWAIGFPDYHNNSWLCRRCAKTQNYDPAALDKHRRPCFLNKRPTYKRWLTVQGGEREGAEVARRTRWRPVDGLRRGGQWFNLGEMKGISSALRAALFSTATGDRQSAGQAGGPVQSSLYMSNHKSYLIISLRRYCGRGRGKRARGYISRPHWWLTTQTRDWRWNPQSLHCWECGLRHGRRSRVIY